MYFDKLVRLTLGVVIMNYLTHFRMPTVMKISGRSSSITNAFINSIIPVVQPTKDDVKEALNILGMENDTFECAYCGDKATEWDHLRPLVLNQKPTGYISEIQNLIPACGKCNQSKGNKSWSQWINSDAPKSPKSRRIEKLQQRINRIEKYESWRTPSIIDFEAIVGTERWSKHWNNWETVLKTMNNSQVLANEIRDIVAENYCADGKIQKANLSKSEVSIQESKRVGSPNEEVEKVRRKLKRWSKRPRQISSRILNKYLELSEKSNFITKEQLGSELPELKTFSSNFDQMNIISDKNHAKIFEMNGDSIQIWEPVASLVSAYKRDTLTIC